MLSLKNSKVSFYSQLLNDTAVQVTSSYEAWISFLTTAARLYKYSYADQLLIFAQRPDATACASYDLWNKTMNRYVRQGSKGIALVDHTENGSRLKYVFEVADTEGRKNSRTPYLWQYRQSEHESVVSSALTQHFSVEPSGDLGQQLESLATRLVEEYWSDHRQDILNATPNSLLEELDELNIGVAFRKATATSTTYMLWSRCGLEPEAHFIHEDFLNIFDFNTPDIIAELGTAVSVCSESVLRQIERAIKQYEQKKTIERRKQNERTDLHAVRRLPDPEPGIGEHRGTSSGQIRQHEEILSSGTPTGSVESAGDLREVVPPSMGDRREGKRAAGSADAETGRGGRSDRRAEDERSSEVGRSDEHLQGTGRGDHLRGTDLLLNSQQSSGQFEQFTMFDLPMLPSQQEQIESIDEAERVFTHSAFSIFQDDIDQILRIGSNRKHSRMVLVSAFQKEKSIPETAALMRQEYQGGIGLNSANGNLSAWYAEDGIHLAKGNTARYAKSAQIISWDDAATRVHELLEAGRFATNVELVESPGYERKSLAQSLWYLYHDLSEDAHSGNYLSILHQDKFRGFPEETAALADNLSDPQFHSILTQQYDEFLDAYSEDRSLLRFHYHKLELLKASLHDLNLPRLEFHSDMTSLSHFRLFITEDEIDAALSSGGAYAGSKARIFDFLSLPHSPKEKADYLKSEYGTGGHSHALSGCAGSGMDHDSHGMNLQKPNCESVFLTWSSVASRFERLIHLDRYFTPEEKIQRQTREEEHILAEADITLEYPLESDTHSSKANEDAVSIPINGEWTPFSSIAEAEKASYEEHKAEVRRNTRNFHITNDQLGEGSRSAKYTANVNAIRLLKQLESEERQAIPEQQEVLSRYVGWGGLADCFDERHAKYGELKNLLSEEEYEAARASTLTAHYTSPVVIRAMYDVIQRMGFQHTGCLQFRN